jgi:hypothetical protein
VKIQRIEYPILPLSAGKKLSQAEVEAEARRLSRRGQSDENEPLEWGTGLKQKKESMDEQARLRDAAKRV